MIKKARAFDVAKGRALHGGIFCCTFSSVPAAKPPEKVDPAEALFEKHIELGAEKEDIHTKVEPQNQQYHGGQAAV